MKDEVMPEGKWTFDDDVTKSFDDMLRRSIPQYELMRALCFDLGCEYVKGKTDVVDLGCSRGEALAPFVRKFGAYNRFVGIEVSKPMYEVSKKRFKGLIDVSVVEILNEDLRAGYPAVNASLTLCVLTMQFIPMEYRLRVLHDVYRTTIGGGALILVEKVLGGSAGINAKFVKLHEILKEANEYTRDQIDRKRLSLEGVLVPVTAAWNEELLRLTGFREVDCFWRNMNFAGWIAVK